MNIIHVPNQHLRQTTKQVSQVDQQLTKFIEQLQQTLEQKRNPRGVGLSAPQVDEHYSVFVTYLSPERNEDAAPIMRTFINPQIVKTSTSKTFGEDPEQPILEGCLSITHLYGPVPRFEWVEFEYQVVDEGKLIEKKERFDAFPARVMQHELDHLHGKLFTDYILEFELPLYDDTHGKLKEIDRKIAEKF
ncbi:MAG: peptide deformylase [Patescibacteria group bacterium]